MFSFVLSTFIFTGIIGKIMNLPIEKIMGFSWQYFAYFEWMGFIVITYFLGQKVFRNEIHSLNYLAQTVSAGGWLYEIPVFFREGHIGLHSHYIANVQVFSFFILIFILYHHKFKPNKIVYASFILFALNLVMSLYNYSFFKNTIVFQRIPTMIMLLSLLTGIPKVAPNKRCEHMTRDGTFVIDKSGVLIRGTGCTRDMLGMASPRECNGVFCRLENKMLTPIPSMQSGGNYDMKCPRCGKLDIRPLVTTTWQIIKDGFMCKDCNLHGNEALFCEDSDKEE